MKTVTALKLAVSSLVIGAATVAVGPALTAENPVVTSKSGIAKVAATAAAKAEKALGARKLDDAVMWAERAVAAEPGNAEFRFLLGQSYLSNGRFASAETTFNDVLALNPAHGRAALKSVLAKIAQGNAADAVAMLEENRANLSVADYGLALALAGDPQAAIDVLEPAAREVGATSTTRQNLGLALALAGRWMDAKAVASQDLPQSMVDKRIVEWAAFARPNSVSEQVASMLGVTPRYDDGQPAALALRSDAMPVAMAAAEAPAPVAEVADAAAPAQAPVMVATILPSAEPAQFKVPSAPAAEAVGPAPEATPAAVAIAEPVAAPAPVVQEEAPIIRSDARPVKQVVVSATPANRKLSAARAVEGGRFVVQLGAFKSASSADSAWKFANRKMSSLSSYDARQSRIKVRGGSLYRLAVSGFASREDASRVCTRVRASGGNCFVRSITNNEPIRFAARRPAGGTVLAARK
jgi:Flp pilus assembly protein TadD/cell division protein FtsN